MIRTRRTAIVGVLTLSVAAMVGSRGRAQSQSSYDFETKKGHITVVGCLQRENFGKHDKYVLVSPTHGPAHSVSDASCDSAGKAATFQLEDSKRGQINESMIGHWVEITGRLGGVQDSNGLRRLHARASRLVPVVVARAEETLAPPMTYQPQATSEPPAAPPVEAVGTSGVTTKELPKTASPEPLIGLLGLIAIAAGFSLRRINGRRNVQGAAE